MKTRNLVLAAVCMIAFAIPSIAAANERGTLKNNTKIRIVYQAGYADRNGHISWQTFALNPGESHNWTVRDPQRQPLHLRWDLTLGDGQFTPNMHRLATSPNGGISAFFLYGNQVWIDTSGSAK